MEEEKISKVKAINLTIKVIKNYVLKSFKFNINNVGSW